MKPLLPILPLKLNRFQPWRPEEKLGIVKLQDFLFHVPFRYDDYSLVSQIGQVQAGEIVTVKGSVEEINNTYTRRFKTLQRATVKDDTGNINILWFNQPFLTKAIHKGDSISLSGKVELDKHKPIMIAQNEKRFQVLT